MREVKEIQMILEDPEFSWHILEGDCETWLVLRGRKRLPDCEINGITQIALERFDWEIAAEAARRALLQGELGFRVSCGIVRLDTLRAHCSARAEEEALARELMLRADRCGFPAYQPEACAAACATLFADRLLDARDIRSMDEDESEEKKEEESETELSEAVVFVLPWRAWLNGEGERQKPRLVKVHVAQTGFGSLLLEAVIRLETRVGDGTQIKPEAGTCEAAFGEKGEQHRFLLEDERVLGLKERDAERIIEVEEIVGLTETPVYTTLNQKQSGAFCLLDSYIKLGVIFITPRKAEERILVAGALLREEKSLAGRLLPPAPPVLIGLTRQARNIVMAPGNKLLWRSETICSLDYEMHTEKDKTEKDKTEKNLHKKDINKTEAAPATSVTPLPLLSLSPLSRPKPGEKYLRKAAARKTDGLYVISVRK